MGSTTRAGSRRTVIIGLAGVLSVVLVVATGNSAQAVTSTYTPVAGSPFPAGANPAGVAVNQVTNTVYVTNYGSDTLAVLDGGTNMPVSGSPFLTGGFNPNAVALNPVTNQIYIPNGISADLSVFQELVSPGITSGAPVPGGVGVGYTATVTANGFPAPTFSVTGGALPNGLSLDTNAGEISGIPTVAGTFPIIVTATNGLAPDAVVNLSITIAAAVVPVPPVIPTNPAGTAGAARGLANTGMNTTALWSLGGVVLPLVAGGVFVCVVTYRKHPRNS